MDWSSIISQVANIFTPSATPTPTPQPANQDDGFDGTELELNRKTFTDLSTSGELSIDETFECYTIECPRVSYQGSHVCIPAGTYAVELVDSPKHGPNTPQLKDVPDRTYIQIHPSNWAINPDTKQVYLLGCIAPGTSKDPNVVYNSKAAMAALMSKIDWTKPVRIVISD
jgi:hypothetical protein